MAHNGRNSQVVLYERKDLPAKYTKTELQVMIYKAFAQFPVELRDAAIVLCDRYHLDPLLKHIFIIPTQNGPQLYISRRGMESVAHDSGVRWSVQFDMPRRQVNPYTSVSDVYLQGILHRTGFPAVQAGRWLSECITRKKDGEPNDVWAKRTHQMHMKAVELELLRIGFDPKEPLLKVLPVELSHLEDDAIEGEVLNEADVHDADVLGDDQEHFASRPASEAAAYNGLQDQVNAGAPAATGPLPRPYQPDKLRAIFADQLGRLESKYSGEPPSAAELNLYRALIRQVLKDDGRLDEFQYLAVGLAHSGDMVRAQVKALLNWLAPVQDEGPDGKAKYRVGNAYALAEANLLLATQQPELSIDESAIPAGK